ncbi:hypothetical protein U1Q18_045881 [Sarracenia purpurea var. burkii]
MKLGQRGSRWRGSRHTKEAWTERISSYQGSLDREDLVGGGSPSSGPRGSSSSETRGSPSWGIGTPSSSQKWVEISSGRLLERWVSIGGGVRRREPRKPSSSIERGSSSTKN